MKSLPLSRKPRCRTKNAAAVPTRRANQTRALLIKGVYEIDPLACPQCCGQMKVIAFIEPRATEWSDGPGV